MGKKTILIIEDEPHIVMGLQDALEFEGYDVASADTGREGAALALQRKPDVVLLDLMLPDINGYQVCEEIRRRDPFMPIIMLTARSQETDKIRGLDAGADDLRHQALQTSPSSPLASAPSYDAPRACPTTTPRS